MKIQDRPLFSKEYISKAEKHYNAQYIGTYPCLSKEGINVENCAVFYVENPDESKGHTNWFGLLLTTTGHSIIGVNPESIVAGLKIGEDFYYGAYRHDHVSFPEGFIDGVAKYYRTNQPTLLASFSLKELAEIQNQGQSFEGDSEVTSEETQDQQCLEADCVVLTKAEAQALQSILQNELFTYNNALSLVRKAMKTSTVHNQLKKFAKLYSNTIKRLEPLQYKLKYNRSRPEQPNRKA